MRLLQCDLQPRRNQLLLNQQHNLAGRLSHFVHQRDHRLLNQQQELVLLVQRELKSVRHNQKWLQQLGHQLRQIHFHKRQRLDQLIHRWQPRIHMNHNLPVQTLPSLSVDRLVFQTNDRLRALNQQCLRLSRDLNQVPIALDEVAQDLRKVLLGHQVL
ncbi:unannotated protein [freshwater metagenome]|uniref:Unannotated protein n=1 Tax=freshwater metagenome TaxID=449393 RepID=A0A6J6KW40_9ZZZZ